MFLTHDSYKGDCPVCTYNLRKSPRKKRAHESEHSPSASGNASDHTEGAGGKKKPVFVREIFSNLPKHSASGIGSTVNTEMPASKIVTEEESANVSGPFEGDTFELTGIPLDRFVEQQFAQIFQCNICLDIPTEAVILSDCHHVFCEHCLRCWLACNGVCPSCRQFVDPEDILPLRQQMLTIFDLLTLRCKYSEMVVRKNLK